MNEELEKLRQFETVQAELKLKLEAAKAEKDMSKIIILLNEERKLNKEINEKMLAITRKNYKPLEIFELKL